MLAGAVVVGGAHLGRLAVLTGFRARPVSLSSSLVAGFSKTKVAG